MFYRNAGKRVLDLTAGVFLIILLSPVYLLVMLVLLIQGRGIFFRQERAGRNGEAFRIIKFRTMIDSDVPDKIKVTRVGRILRNFSLDELPQLFNVLSGEMSLVGPRPLLMKYNPLYNQEQRKRLRVRPGVTGLAQVKGRNRLTWDEKFSYDLEYIDTISLKLDLIILLKTVNSVFEKDIHLENEEFTGNF